jgi:hypothetical protein
LPRSDAALRQHTRLLLIYNLTPQVQVGKDVLRPMTAGLELGRFTAHVHAAGRLLPQLVFSEEVPDLSLAGAAADAAGVLRAKIMLAVTPRWDPLLFLDVEIGSQAAGDIAEVLFATWQDRASMRVGGAPVTDWLAGRANAMAPGRQMRLAFGRNVHQCVFPGRDLAQDLLAEHLPGTEVSPDTVTIVLRGTLDGQSGAALGIRRPEALNNPGQTMVAHGRGVSLIVGWAPAVENAFALAAAGILNAVAAVHRLRRLAFGALDLNESAVISSADDVRTLVEQLSGRLGALQLDLSFSVEAYADSILIPELLVESFHSSLRAASALAEGLANTSRIVERVESVLAGRRVVLESATQHHTERRDKVFTAVIAAGSVLALPPALLLAFFGVNSSNVNPHYSILDIHHYGVAYLLAWLPFVLLAAIGTVARRLIRLDLSRRHRETLLADLAGQAAEGG